MKDFTSAFDALLQFLSFCRQRLVDDELIDERTKVLLNHPRKKGGK